MEFEQLLTDEVYSKVIKKAKRFDSRNHEDLAHNTLLNACTKFSQFRGGNFYSWICGIMRNCFLSEIRLKKGKKQKLVSFGEAPEFEDQSPSQEISDEMKSVLMTLNPRHQQLIYLIAINGYTCEEAAKILSIPRNTVLSGLYRARWKMRDGLESA